jgi:hypothetical protein
MSAIDATMQARSPAVVGRLRIMLVATLLAGLLGGFSLARVTDRGGSAGVPDRWASVSAGDYSGPGHVSRHWVDQASLGDG